MFLAFHDSSVQIVHKGPSYIYIYIERGLLFDDMAVEASGECILI